MTDTTRTATCPITLSRSVRSCALSVPLEGTHIAGVARPLHLREYGTYASDHLREIARRRDLLQDLRRRRLRNVST